MTVDSHLRSQWTGRARCAHCRSAVILTSPLLSVSRSRRPAWDPTIVQLVLDLSPLRFADCCGARALAAVTRAVPR